MTRHCHRLCEWLTLSRDGFGADDGIKLGSVSLGLIGRSGPEIQASPTVNDDIASYVPMVVELVEAGKLIPNQYQIVGDVGFDGVIKALDMQAKGAGSGAKLVVRLQSA